MCLFSISMYSESKIYISYIIFNIFRKVKSGLSNFHLNHYTHDNVYIRTDYYTCCFAVRNVIV